MPQSSLNFKGFLYISSLRGWVYAWYIFVWVHAAARYLLDNREVQIEWQYATEPGGQAEMAAILAPDQQLWKCPVFSGRWVIKGHYRAMYLKHEVQSKWFIWNPLPRYIRRVVFWTFLFCSIWVLTCCHGCFFWCTGLLDDNDSTSGPFLIAYFVTVTVRFFPTQHGLTYWTRASAVPLSGLLGGGRWPIATALQWLHDGYGGVGCPFRETCSKRPEELQLLI